LDLGFWELYWELPAALVEYVSRRIGRYDVGEIKRFLALIAVSGPQFLRIAAKGLLSDESRLYMIIDDLESGIHPRREFVELVERYVSGIVLS